MTPRAVGPPGPVPGVGDGLKVAAIGLPGLPVPSVSPVVGDLRHSWACGWVQRGGMCDCGTSQWVRGFDYGRLAGLLAEGWYEQDQQELSS
jgi:hypothetical protein